MTKPGKGRGPDLAGRIDGGDVEHPPGAVESRKFGRGEGGGDGAGGDQEGGGDQRGPGEHRELCEGDWERTG